MEKSLNGYLEKIEKSLKPLPISERVDIVKEIKSEILELQGDGKTPEEIVARLGDPKELAKAYLGDLIAKSGSRGWNRVLAICAYYSLASLSGLIVIPVLAICAPVFIVCGVACPILMAIKMVDFVFELGLPYVEHMGVFTGIVELNPIAEFGCAVVVGVGLYFAGRGCWKLLVRYIQGVGKAKRHLSI